MSVFVCGANSDLTHVELVRFDVLEWGRYIPDQRRLSAAEVWEKWQPITLQVQGLRRKGARTQDVYQIGYFGGMSLVVSEKCRTAIDVRFPGSCTFLPVTITNVRANFFALWANCVRDESLNLVESDISHGIGSLKNVNRYAFREDELIGQGLFRLSPCFSGVDDLATQEFVDLVNASSLIGFSFWDRGATSRDSGN